MPEKSLNYEPHKQVSCSGESRSMEPIIQQPAPGSSMLSHCFKDKKMIKLKQHPHRHCYGQNASLTEMIPCYFYQVGLWNYISAPG